jgi:hypothetical protein
MKWRNVWSVSGVFEEEFSRITESYVGKGTIKYAMSVDGVRRAKAALSSGCKPHPATAPAGSNRSSHGGNEVAEAFD